MQDITKYFKKAGLEIALTDKPIGRFNSTDENANRIFQMTIDLGKQERFRIFKGQGNDVRVLDLDKNKEQVLLYVKEPKRIFKEVHFDREKGRDVETIRETPDHIRRYLMGMDETHYFISELPDAKGKINDINDAHRALKPFEVKDRKKRKKAKIHRQGEWFFVNATAEELMKINETSEFIMQKCAISRERQGKPHTVDYLIRVGEVVFIKGKVRHDDHRTQKFITWQRVFRNTEKQDVNTSNIHGWID